MKVYCCQLNIQWEDKAANFRRVEKQLTATPPEPGSLVVLPEMFATGFSMNVSGIHEAIEGETFAFIQKLARRFSVFVVGGIVTRADGGKGLNEAVAVNPAGERVGRYAKIHPFTFGTELDHYERGSEIISFEWNGVKAVPFICYDLRFPEIFRSAVRSGAELFIVIANWPSKREQHWVTLLEARAIENLAYVVGVNRAGTDPKHVYPGRTRVIDPHGKVLTDAGSAEGMISAEINPAVVREWRREFPALNDIHWRD